MMTLGLEAVAVALAAEPVPADLFALLGGLTGPSALALIIVAFVRRWVVLPRELDVEKERRVAEEAYRAQRRTPTRKGGGATWGDTATTGGATWTSG